MIDIISIFESLGGYNTGTQMNFLCPFTYDGSCDDHSKGSMKGRFYISVDSGTYGYTCFKCGKSGYVNRYILMKMGCSKDTAREIMAIIVQSRHDIGFDFSYSKGDRIRNSMVFPTTASKNILEYFHTRMGVRLDANIAGRFNIIANLREFANINKCRFLPGAHAYIMARAKTGIGFMSYDRSHIIIRDIGKGTKDNGKYGSYQIRNVKDADKMFRISENRHVSPELDVFMAEGQFDVIGMYIFVSRNQSLYSRNDKEFIGVSGIRYHSAILKLINSGEIRPINLYIIKDDGVSDQKIIDRMKFNTPLKAYQILKNSNGKDTGDPVKDGPPVFKSRIIRERR